jgi:lipid II:glycine glycyltransferase (peptidoglycan interpeptide bridge formation enzyme)
MTNIVAEPRGWNEDVLRRGGDFLQSWEWGEFQRKAGSEVVRVQAETGAMAQLLRRALPFGKRYWYCPRGPLGGLPDLAKVPEIALGVFLRFEPLSDPSIALGTTALVKVHDVQPRQTLIVDLRQDREALMAAMHEKWRYNIRLAERKGVRVYVAGPSDASAIDVFWDLLNETTERDRFRAHGKEYYRSMLEMLSGDPASDGRTRPVARLVFAEHDGKVLAANLMIYFGTTATYLHGASSRERREVMAPHLLHWTAMTQAKDWGYASYDFWGIAPEGAENHPWAGITRFKRGFGGASVAYPGTYDLPIDRFWYALYSTAQRLRGRD